MLDFGLSYNMRNPNPFKIPFPKFYEEMIEQIVYAEQLGFDTVWLPEHHFSPDDGYNPASLTFAAAIAARTKKIKIGTWLLLLPLHHALEVAEQAAIIDIISDGRLILGLGLGYRREEYEAFGISRKHRASRMEEGLEVIRKALGTEQFSFSGRHYDLKNASVYPKPVQQPFPIWVGARSKPAAERAARHDASLLLIDVGGNARETYDSYTSVLRARGKDPASYGIHGMVTDSFFISDDPELTRAEIQPYVEWQSTAMAGWYEESAESGHDPVLWEAMKQKQIATREGSDGEPSILRAQRRDAAPHVVGSASEIVNVISRKLEEVPYTHLVWGGGNTTPSGYPARKMYPYMERFANEVMPHFR